MELGNLSLRTHFLWFIRVYEATNNPPGGDIVENHVLMVNLQTLPIVLMFRGKVVMSFIGWFEECMRSWHYTDKWSWSWSRTLCNHVPITSV